VNLVIASFWRASELVWCHLLDWAKGLENRDCCRLHISYDELAGSHKLRSNLLRDLIQTRLAKLIMR
jgi:hypothetical protein